MKKILILILTVSVMTSVITSVMALPSYAAEKEINWTREELQFMKEHPAIKLGVDPEFVPFEFIDEDGEYKGIAADYLAIISKKTGLKFEIQKGLTWPEAYDMAVNGEIDALPLIGKTPQRQEHFVFSEPYYYFKRVIVTRETEKGISNIEDLEGRIIAVQRNSSHHSYLLEHPEINISLYDSVEAGLTAVATGKERAFLGNLATTNYMIRTHGLTGLRYIAFEAEKEQALHFAVRKDWPELVSIFDKAMDTITQNQKTAINNKWIDLQTDIDYGPIIRILLIVGSIIVLIFIVSFFWIVRLRKEIRRRKEIQKALEKAKLEADEANEFKSNFLARMSHEIRTPLNAITGISYLLKKTDISFTQSMYVDRIMRAADNMLGIVNDILDFAKIEAGKIELEKVPFSMDTTIREVVNIVSYKIEEQGIRFRVFKDPAIPDWFIGDPNRIQQILQNVLGNASKFTKAGEISLDVSLVSKKEDHHILRFTVRDTGIGMTEEQKQKLFAPFIQADSSINRRFGGSGLGLSIVKNLVEMMEGEVRISSVPGEGTEFIIEIPLDTDKQKEVMYEKMLSTRAFKEAKILTLQKKDHDMEPVCRYLSYFGMTCETVYSEEEAMQMMESSEENSDKPFDLMITSCGKSSGSGFEFVKNLRNKKKMIEIPPIIMLIPMNRYDLFDKLHENGIERGIAQPVTPYNILNEVTDALGIKKDRENEKANGTKKCLPSKEEKYHAILADDKKTNQLIAKTLLEQMGIQAIIANNGKEAIEIYKERKKEIDLILIDLHMPVMNGYEAAAHIRKISADVPILALSADVISGVREKCCKNGIYKYISKPLEPEKFMQAIKDVLSEGREISVLDTDLGLRNMGNDQELYEQVLDIYLAENSDLNEELSKAIYQKKYEDASKMVHKIKSSSGSIGANNLYESAVSLQRALSEENEREIPSLEEKFCSLLIRLLGEIRSIRDQKNIK